MPAAFTQTSRPPVLADGVLGERANRASRRGRRRCRATAGGPRSQPPPRAAASGVDVGDDNGGAGLGEPGAAGAPDAARSSGDDRDRARQRDELRERVT